MRIALVLIFFLILLGCSTVPVYEPIYRPVRIESQITRKEPAVLAPREPASIGDWRSYFGIHANTCRDKRGILGAYIVGFYKNSPAQEKGLSVGDKVIKFGIRRINSSGDLTMAIKFFPLDDAASISVVRKNGQLIQDIFVIGRGYYYPQTSNDHIDKPDEKSLCSTIGLLPP